MRVEKIALARAIQKINAMSPTGRSPDLQGMQIKFDQSAYNPRVRGVVSYSFQIDPHHIQMCRGRNPVIDSPGYFAHEIGHLLGNNNAARLYSGYKAGPLCNLSTYSHTNWATSTYRNEEFAESFAAFVTHPDLLTQSPACQRALRYFQSQFPHENQSTCQERITPVVEQRAPAPPPPRPAPAPPVAAPAPTRVLIETSVHEFVPYTAAKKMADSAPDKVQEAIAKVPTPQPAAQLGGIAPYMDYAFVSSTYTTEGVKEYDRCAATPTPADCIKGAK